MKDVHIESISNEHKQNRETSDRKKERAISIQDFYFLNQA